jgi:glycerol kinase
MPDEYILAIDQGTSSSKAVLVDAAGATVASGSAPVGAAYPRPGWVEQDAVELYESVLAAAAECLDGVDRATVAGVGLSTQRESALIWDRRTGEPLGPMLGWQDQRSSQLCAELRGSAEKIRSISGLPLDPMFSAAKVRWLLDHADGGDIAFGTVDSWLRFKLTGQHVIEIGNASRTQLLDVRTGEWSPELLDLFGIPASLLPELTPSAGDLGVAGPLGGLPIRAVLGDSHAALRAHGAAATEGAKVTYGTGSSVMRLGSDSPDGPICLTIAWGDPSPRLAAEGNIRSSGATIAWLAQLLRIEPDEVAALGAEASSDGVHLVPAFTGLGAPWWDDRAVGLISGLTLGSGPAQLARAALESVAHQVTDILDAMAPAVRILADGGASANDTLMRLQADLAGIPVHRARAGNLSALGAAHLAGACAGLWDGSPGPLEYDVFSPGAVPATPLRDGWRAAVARALSTESQRS